MNRDAQLATAALALVVGLALGCTSPAPSPPRGQAPEPRVAVPPAPERVRSTLKGGLPSLSDAAKEAELASTEGGICVVSAVYVFPNTQESAVRNVAGDIWKIANAISGCQRLVLRMSFPRTDRYGNPDANSGYTMEANLDEARKYRDFDFYLKEKRWAITVWFDTSLGSPFSNINTNYYHSDDIDYPPIRRN